MKDSATMTEQQKIEWLQQYQRARRGERLANLALELAREEATRISPVLDGMPRKSGHSDRVPRAAEQLAEAESACADAALICHRARQAVRQAIAGVPDADQREVLHRRYLLGQTLTAISGQMMLDYRWVRRLHRRALDTLTPQEQSWA